MKFIIKLFPEITIKSKPVRQRQTKQLRQNIQNILRREVENPKVKGHWDKIEVDVPDDHADTTAELLQLIPGIANILKVQRHLFDDINEAFDNISELVTDAYGPVVAGKTFVVRIKRAGTDHNFTSHEMEIKLGGSLLKLNQSNGVSLKNPEVTVKLEIRDNELYLIDTRYEGLGGYPMGTQEPVLSLISGGFDSGVSTYLTMKRGIRTHFCFFNLGGIAHEIGVKQVAHYLWYRYGSSHRVKFITIPFEGVVAEILRNVNHSEMAVVLKRMMYRAAEKAATELECEALVTGEAVAQVSSQTLANLRVIESATDALVLRPLITMDKSDIISMSAHIGTEEFAKTMPEYCGVISSQPSTKVKMKRVLEEEAKMDMAVLDKAFEQIEVLKIDQVLESKTTIAEVELVKIPEVSDVIVDIRSSDEIHRKPLELTNNSVIQIPFFELHEQQELFQSQTHRFLLYCEHGTMSQLHASNLKTQGIENIAVFKRDS